MSFNNHNAGQWVLSGQLADDQPLGQYTVDRSPYTIGRRSDRALVIASPTVSGAHAELVAQGSKLFVCDRGSTNGTFVNGARVTGSCALNHGDLLQFANIVFRVLHSSTAKYCATVANDSADRALALIQFDKLMAERAVVPHFQPLITMQDRQVMGYEVLGRSRLFGLTDPHSMFTAAAILNLEGELSRIFRIEGAREGQVYPADHSLFLNTHPTELNDLPLLELSLRELRQWEPSRPLVLEIHEATATRSSQMRELLKVLKDLDIGLAYDDFGAGQARLVELADVPPNFLKFDMKLLQGIAAASTDRQKMVERLVEMTLDLGAHPLAEGIETEEDHAFCCSIGFEYGQGFLYGRPAASPAVDTAVLSAH